MNREFSWLVCGCVRCLYSVQSVQYRIVQRTWRVTSWSLDIVLISCAIRIILRTMVTKKVFSCAMFWHSLIYFHGDCFDWQYEYVDWKFVGKLHRWRVWCTCQDRRRFSKLWSDRPSKCHTWYLLPTVKSLNSRITYKLCQTIMWRYFIHKFFFCESLPLYLFVVWKLNLSTSKFLFRVWPNPSVIKH
jgi:hypothetical protein